MAVTDVAFNISYNVTNPEAIDAQKKSAEELGKTLESLKNKRISLINQADAARDLSKMKDLNAALAETDAALSKLGAKRTRLISEQGATSDAQALERIKAQLQATEAQIDKMSAKRLRILDEKGAQADIKNIRQISAEISAAEKQMGKLTQTTSYFGRVAREAQGVFAGMVGFAAIQTAARGFLDLGKNIVQAATEIESIESRFTVLLKSSTKAQNLIRQATELAIVSPFTQQAVLEGAQTLLASGINANSLLSTLRQVAEISGASETTFQRLIVNVSQINALGKLQGGEIRQFAQNGIPLMAALQKQFGKTSAEITKMAETGKISATAFNKALASLSAEGGLFEGAMEKAAQTVEGKYSTLKDRIQLTFQQIGKAFLPAIHSFLDAANAFLKGLTPEKVQAFVNVLITLAGWVVTLGKGLLYLGTIWAAQRILILAYSGAVTVLTAAQAAWTAVSNGALTALVRYGIGTSAATIAVQANTTATVANTTATTASAGAVGMLRNALALLLSPLGLAIGAITGFVFIINKLNEEMDATIKKTEEMQNAFNASAASLKADIQGMIDSINALELTDIGAQVKSKFDATNILGQPAQVTITAKAIKEELLKAQAEFDAIAARQAKGDIKTVGTLNMFGTKVEIKERAATLVKTTQDGFDAYTNQLTKIRQKLEVEKRKQVELDKQIRDTAVKTFSQGASNNLITAAAPGVGGVLGVSKLVGATTDTDAKFKQLLVDKEANKEKIKELELLNDEATFRGKLLRIFPDEIAASGKAQHIAKLRRDLLVADTKAIEDNIRAMNRQTREFLQQQINLEEAQAGRFTRVKEMQQEFDAEQTKTLEDATEREIVATRKLTEDLLKERRQLATAAVGSKNEDSETTERRVAAVIKAGELTTQAERNAAYKRILGHKDLAKNLIALDQNYAEESLKIAEKQQEDLLAILVRNTERQSLLLAQENIKLIEQTKAEGHALNKSLADLETERANIAGSQFEEDRQAQVAALKQQAQLRLNEITTREANETKIKSKLEQRGALEAEARAKARAQKELMIAQGASQEQLNAVDIALEKQLALIDTQHNLLLVQLDKYHADVKEANFKAFKEQFEQQVAFGAARNAELQKQADKDLKDRQSQTIRQALFPGLVEDVRGFGTTGRGAQLLNQRAANQSEINNLENQIALTEKQTAADGVNRDEFIKAARQKIQALGELNAALEQTFGDERAARRRKNFMTIADGIGQIASATTSGMRALYAANEQFFANAANRQKTKIEDVKNTLIAAQTAGNANLTKINAEQLQLEEARLDQLNKIREEYVRKQQALAVIELIANSTIAIAKAAAEGGIAAPFTIAATLIALAVGLAQAKAQAAAAVAGFKEGGYTGDGGNSQTAGVVHKREFVFTAEKTKQNRKEFEQLHAGKFDLKERLAKASLADTLLNSQLRMRADIAEKVIIVKDGRFDDLRRLFESGFAKIAAKQGAPANHLSIHNRIKGNDLAQIVTNEQKADARRRK